MARLQAETERLRHEEAEIMAKISSALEKENLDKEKPGMSSELLSRDMEEVKDKLEKLGRKRKEVFEEEGEKAEVRKQRDAVVQCYLQVHLPRAIFFPADLSPPQEKPRTTARLLERSRILQAQRIQPRSRLCGFLALNITGIEQRSTVSTCETAASLRKAARIDGMKEKYGKRTQNADRSVVHSLRRGNFDRTKCMHHIHAHLG